MEVIEESAIAASTTPLKIWKRYVDDMQFCHNQGTLRK